MSDDIAGGGVLAQVGFTTLLHSPLVWGLAVCALGLWGTLTSADKRLRRLGQLIGCVGLIVLAIALPKLSHLSTFHQWMEQIVFWILAGSSIGCSAAAITAKNPVYTAIWFAASLLGVGGLFLFQQAQFLGVATIVVYAGAIVVTFLFVLMLANPEGHAQYDRISWSRFPAPLMIVAAATLVAIVTGTFLNAPPQPAAPTHPAIANGDGMHMARLGGELFSRHLIAVEIVGTILLVALVGAVAIVIQGRGHRAATHSSADAAWNGRNQR